MSSVLGLRAVLAVLALLPAGVRADALTPPAIPASIAAEQSFQAARPARESAPYALLTLDQRRVKWGAPLAGTGAVIRYAFVAAPVDRPEGVNCTSMAPIDAGLPGTPVTAARFESEIRHAMAAWEAAADIRFEPAADPASADLMIGVQREPQGIAFADVILKERGPDATASIGQAAICFNPELAWEDSFDGDDDTPDVRYVAAHELGHVIGLDHAWGPDKLMNFKYREILRAPQPADLAGAAFLYGPPPGDAPVAARTGEMPVAHGGDPTPDR